MVPVRWDSYRSCYLESGPMSPKSCWNCKGANLFRVRGTFKPTFKFKQLTVVATTTYCGGCGQTCMNDKQMDKFIIAVKTAYLAYKLKKQRARGASK